jgi:hypothetical protein
MHDPLHVVFAIRRPPLGRPRPAREKDPLPALAFWRLRPALTAGRDGEERRTPWRRRVMFSGAFFRVGRWEWYLPSVLTVWHRDPQTDGTDSSCGNRARRRRQAAIKQHHYLAAAWWDWWWRRYDVFHVHHWTVQLDFAQELRRRLLTRCATCGGRSTSKRPVNHSLSWGDGRPKSFRDRWLRGEQDLHHGDCSALASVRATKESLPAWLHAYGHDEFAMRMQREREPYMGSYAWWREAILGEAPDVAAALAAAHVQRSAHPCPVCGGTGHASVVGALTAAARGEPLGEPCGRCEGTGHERVERPIPAELV